MIDNPKISIVVPIYNVELFLKDCIESVLNQSFRDFEVILVDDGSTDSSPDICDYYANTDNRIKVFHKMNGGLSSARNYGIGKASGEYLIFLDSDDFWTNENILSLFYDKAITEDLDIIRAEYKRVNELGVLLNNKQISDEKVKYQNETFNSYRMIKTLIHGENFIVLFFIKKNLLGNIRFNENLKFQEDIDFVVRFFSIERRCGYIADQFYAYRQRQNSITNTPNLENVIDSFSFCDMYYDYSLLAENKKLSDLYVYYSIMMYKWTLETVASKEYISRYSEIDKVVKLIKLRKRVYSRTKILKYHKFPIQIYVSPFWGIKFFHLRWFIGRFLKFLNLK